MDEDDDLIEPRLRQCAQCSEYYRPDPQFIDDFCSDSCEIEFDRDYAAPI